MAKGKGDRLIVTLGCTECRERTYTSSKNRRNDPDRIELRKFCPPLPATPAAQGDKVAKWHAPNAAVVRAVAALPASAVQPAPPRR